MRSQSRGTSTAIRPRMWDAKQETWTQGKTRYLELYAIKRMLRRRASRLQPMNRSRGPKCRAAEDHARHALRVPAQAACRGIACRRKRRWAEPNSRLRKVYATTRDGSLWDFLRSAHG